MRCSSRGICTNGTINSDFIKAGDFLKKYEIMNDARAEDREIVYLGIYKYK
jgi:hypothetical protein